MSRPQDSQKQPKKCRCGSTKVYLHQWHMGEGGTFWCADCGAGTPERPDTWEALTVQGAMCGSREPARLKWNAWAAAGRDERPS